MEGRRPGYREIAEEISSPVQYMAKILQIFTRHEVIKSVRGRGGGFFFASPESVLPLTEVIHLTEGDKFNAKCGFGWNQCDPLHPCPMHDRYKNVRDELNKLLENESIQSLAGKIRDHRAILNRMNPAHS